MTTLPFVQLRSLESIIPFKSVVEGFLAKYGPSNEITEASYAEFMVLSNSIVTWLKKEYAEEVSNTSLFYDNGRNTPPYMVIDRSGPAYKGLDAWLSAQTRTEPHGGSIGAQELFNASPAGIMFRQIPALLLAYSMCKQEKIDLVERKRKQKEDLLKKIAYYKDYLTSNIVIRFNLVKNAYRYSIKKLPIVFEAFNGYVPSLDLGGGSIRDREIQRQEQILRCPITKKIYDFACKKGEEMVAIANAKREEDRRKVEEQFWALEKRKADLLAESIAEALTKRNLH